MNALVIEDDDEERAFLTKGLTEIGYACDAVASGKLGHAKLVNHAYDLALVDLMLPEMDGREIIARARAAGIRTHIIVISALGSVPDRVRGLEIGADEYMPKPCSMEELKARISAFNRSQSWSNRRTLSAHGIVLDTVSHTCVRNGRSISLSKIEFALLECLMRNRGTVLTPELLLEQAWGYTCEQTTNLVAPHICRLRGKLTSGDDENPIENRRGGGYVFL